MPENRIREFRDRLGLSQTELARRVKIAPQNLSNIERGRLAPWPKVMQALAKALKTTPEDLFPAQAKQEAN